MGLEKFEPSGGRAGATRPLISLRKSAGIGINQPALDEYFEDAEAVEMYYDEEENRVGLKPVDEKAADNYTLTRTESGGSVTPKSFFKHHDLTPEITKRYKPEWNGNNQIVLIDLEEGPVGTYGSPADEESEETETEDEEE